MRYQMNLTGVRPFVILFVFVLVVTGCSYPYNDDGNSAAQVPSSGQVPFSAQKMVPSAEILWNEILAPANGTNYTKWKFFPEGDLEFPAALTDEPHGDYVAVFVNDLAYESLKHPSDPFKMKVGSVIVKENYKSTKPSLDHPIGSRDDLASRTVMWKVNGYTNAGGATKLINPQPPNPAPREYLVGGEWFFAMYVGQGAARPQPIVTISDQPFITKRERQGRFVPFVGEVQAGRPWFCISCHHVAVGPPSTTPSGQNSYGDYMFRLTPFKTP